MLTPPPAGAGQPVGPSGYVYDNAWAQAGRRLRLLEETYDPGTFRRLTALGVGPGWSCLELGAGAGSVARWLCERVGPEGRVVAVDIDTRLLSGIEANNLEVHRCDVTADPLPGQGFDLVHVRAVLMHLPERESVLPALVDALRPGGWLLVEEGDYYPVTAIAAGPYQAAWAAVNEALEREGRAAGWARCLPALLDGQGLDGVESESDVPMFRGGSPTAELVWMTWEQGLERAVLAEDDREHVRHARAELADPRRWFPMAAVVAAWGRRPAAAAGQIARSRPAQ